MTDTVDRGAMLKRSHSSQPHDCPSCNAGRAMKAIEAALIELDVAVDGFIEQSTDFEGSYYYLRDELADIAKLPLAWPVRKRLLTALRTASR